MTELTGNSLEFSRDARNGAAKRFAISDIDFFEDEDFSISSSKINLAEEIARGSYGVVYKGYMEGNTYAIKMEDFIAGEEQTNMLIELSLLQSLSHPRLVQFCGASYVSKSSAGAKVMILLELCENGAMREFLQRPLFNLPNPSGWNVLLRLCADVAEGLEFLHKKGIVHRDIKTTNVLVDASWRAKLCDFSFASHESSTVKKEHIYGTEEFMAPEIAMGMDFDISADMFSYGMILCEVVTGKEPSADFLNRSPRNMFALDESELRQHVMPGCPDDLQVTALQCCDVDPAYRPSATQCLEMLNMELAAAGGPEAVEKFVESVKNAAAGTSASGSLTFSSDALVIDTASANGVETLTVAGLNLSSPNREGTVKYPRTDELDHLRATMWGQNVGPLTTGEGAAAASLTLESVVNEFNNRFACIQLELQQVQAENKKLHSNIHALVALMIDREKRSAARERDTNFSTDNSINSPRTNGVENEEYYHQRMASIEKRLRDPADSNDNGNEAGDRSKSPEESVNYYNDPQVYNHDEYDHQRYDHHERHDQSHQQHQNQQQHKSAQQQSYEGEDSRSQSEDGQGYGVSPTSAQEGRGMQHQHQYPQHSHQYEYEHDPDLNPPQSHNLSQEQQYLDDDYQQQDDNEDQSYKQHNSMQSQPPAPTPQQQSRYSGISGGDSGSSGSGQSSNAKVALQSFLSSVSKAKVHSTKALRSVDRNMQGLSARGQLEASPLPQNQTRLNQSQNQQLYPNPRVSGHAQSVPLFASPTNGSSPQMQMQMQMQMQESDLAEPPSLSSSFSYSRSNSPLSTRRQIGGGRANGKPTGNTVRGSDGNAASIIAAAAMSGDQRLQQASRTGLGSPPQYKRAASPSSISGGSLHSTVSMSVNSPAAALSKSTHHPASNRKNVVVHSMPMSPRRTTGSQGGLLASSRDSPGSPKGTPASAMATWRENKTPFVRAIAPSGSGQRGREQLRVNTSASNFIDRDRDRDRSVSPTSTIRSNTTSGTMGLGANRLPPPPPSTRARSPVSRKDPNFSGSNGADTFFQADPQELRIDLDYDSFQKHNRQRTYKSPLHRPSNNNGSFNLTQACQSEVEKAVDFQGGLRLKSNLTDYNQGSVAGRKTVVTSIAGLVPSPRVSPQPVRGNNSAGVGSSLAHYLSQSQR